MPRKASDNRLPAEAERLDARIFAILLMTFYVNLIGRIPTPLIQSVGRGAAAHGLT